jgi:iron(III) transport system substrate-binding protein
MVCVALLAASSVAAGCWKSEEGVVAYTALDREFSEPIYEAYAAQSGTPVAAKYDAESTKTVGLVEMILAERERPRCDLFWNNEILHTLRLEKLGLLEPFKPAAAEAFPAQWRSPDGNWHGLAARARVLIVNTQLVPDGERPTSIHALTDAKWRGRCGLAKPLFGTTATHAACLFAAWGDEKAQEFFRDVKANDVQILSGNKQVALGVGAGQLAFGLTDTDDAIIEVEKGLPVAIVYPDIEEGGLGTLYIPNTLAIIRGGPNTEQAKRLVEYLLSPEVEARLAEGPSAQIPLNPSVEAKLRIPTPQTARPMTVDWPAAAEHWDGAAAFLREQFTGG